MVDTFAALGAPTRFRIVELLRSGPHSVSEIDARLRLGQPQVSKQLRVLKDAQLVEVTPRGQQRLYALRAEPLKELSGWLERYRQIWDARFAALDKVVAELGDRKRKGKHV